MDDKTKTKIFEPFFTTKELGRGTGLGMAIVYGIIKQHNGFIHVYSEPGIGTTFRIYLPLMARDQLTDEEVIAPAAPAGGNETILVAEDEPAVRKLLKEILVSYGYTVILAEDGRDAIEKFVTNRDSVKLILMDMIMPKMNGKEAYDKIRKLDAGIKAIFTSGYTMDIINSRDGMHDDTDLIMKPVQPVELLRRVREMLDR
jgi:polar amino acid transport system substrate-binding protein